MLKIATSFLLGVALTLAVTAFSRTRQNTPTGSDQLTRATFINNAEYQDGFTLQVLNLVNVAQRIRSGHAPQLENDIAHTLPQYLRFMENFGDTPTRTATFYVAGNLFKASNITVPADLQRQIALANAKAKQVLSKDCFQQISCIPGAGCVPWPTSLKPVNPKVLDPQGWHYIQGSHCGFSWPKFWKLECGEPIGLTPCTGDD
ncbi:MAG TPA: hypothetical protein VKT78_15610 [Fimbriimonadaceae bacterium]|nr:hypothetical protein [Fimbriimonadaceae bacterium]